MPVFLSTPKSDDDVVLPFKFTGGLGLATSKIGCMLAVQGVYSMIAQLWLFIVAPLAGALIAGATYGFVVGGQDAVAPLEEATEA